MDKVSYVLIGMMAGSIITLFVMALLSIAKKEDKSLERLSKARKESKALKDEAVELVTLQGVKNENSDSSSQSIQAEPGVTD